MRYRLRRALCARSRGARGQRDDDRRGTDRRCCGATPPRLPSPAP